MEDFTIDSWRDYIKSHENEFDIQIAGPDRYNLWRVDVTPIINRNYSEYYEDTDKNVALDHAITRLTAILYQYYKTPENL